MPNETTPLPEEVAALQAMVRALRGHCGRGDRPALVRRLYAVEREAAGLDPAASLALRQARSLPALAEMREQPARWHPTLLPRHPMAEAVGYALNQWPELYAFAHDGAVPIDNNASEREIKRVVLNRKWRRVRRRRLERRQIAPERDCRTLSLAPNRVRVVMMVQGGARPPDSPENRSQPRCSPPGGLGGDDWLDDSCDTGR